MQTVRRPPRLLRPAQHHEVVVEYLDAPARHRLRRHQIVHHDVVGVHQPFPGAGVLLRYVEPVPVGRARRAPDDAVRGVVRLVLAEGVGQTVHIRRIILKVVPSHVPYAGVEDDERVLKETGIVEEIRPQRRVRGDLVIKLERQPADRRLDPGALVVVVDEICGYRPVLVVPLHPVLEVLDDVPRRRPPQEEDRLDPPPFGAAGHLARAPVEVGEGARQRRPPGRGRIGLAERQAPGHPAVPHPAPRDRGVVLVKPPSRADVVEAAGGEKVRRDHGRD